MQVEIISPGNTLYSGSATVVTVPSINGSFQIMNNHAPVIAALSKGTVVIKNENGVQEFNINGGIVEVLKNNIVILA